MDFPGLQVVARGVALAGRNLLKRMLFFIRPRRPARAPRVWQRAVYPMKLNCADGRHKSLQRR